MLLKRKVNFCEAYIKKFFYSFMFSRASITAGFQISKLTLWWDTSKKIYMAAVSPHLGLSVIVK